MNIDKDLILRCRKKERAAQKELYEILLPYLGAVCRRYLRNPSDVGDAVQEAFISLFRGIDKYDDSKAGMKTWSVRIAINSSLKLNQRMYKMETLELIPESCIEGQAPCIVAQLSNEELVQTLKRMPRDYFEVFNLNVIDGYSHKEVAEILVIDESLSRKRLSRARKWISERFEQEKELDTRIRRSV